MLIDSFERKISYLRVSVTDRCDFRCTYCMSEDMNFLPKKDVLSLEELARLCNTFIDLGVRKLRITGGEPLVRKNIMQLFNSLGKKLGQGLEELTLTTNGSQLGRYAKSLYDSGVRRINVSLDNATGEVLVPSTDYHQSKMLLAAEGLPESLPNGYDNLNELPMGTSRSVEAVKIRQSLEHELARSVNEISGILGARVHLAIPEKSVFVRERGKPTASIFVKLGAGRSLGQNQIRAIVHLVSSSVPNLPSENVTVVDQHGNLLSRPTDDPTSAMSNRQLEYTMKLEQVYRQRVISLLTPILGAGNITAQVSVDVDFTTKNITEEIVDPEGSAIRSEQATQDTTSEPEAKGIPGAVANTPPLAAELGTEAPAPQQSPSKVKSQSSSSIWIRYW